MNDIAPELLDKVMNEFNKLFKTDSTIQSLYRKIEKGTATELQSYQFVKRCSELNEVVFRRYVNSATLPDEKMYFNIAERTIIPMLEHEYGIISNYAIDVQGLVLNDLKLGLNPIQPVMDMDRAKGIVDVATSKEVYDDVQDSVLQKMTNYNYHIVDKLIEDNSRFLSNSGITSTITRRTVGKTCDWCRNLAGSYTYPDVEREVFMRHDNCDCTIEVKYSKNKRPSYYMMTRGNAFVRNG